MEKTVVINLGAGSLVKGFPYVTARLWTTEYPQAQQFIGSLEAAPALVEHFRLWQSTYRALANRYVLRQQEHAPKHKSSKDDTEETDEDELEIDAGGVTHISQQSFEDYSQQLSRAVNSWLSSAGLWTVEKGLRSHLSPTETIRVIFETDDPLVRRLPWQCWHFFKDYPLAEMALSRPEYQRQAISINNRQQMRILAIVGDRRGIDVALEQQLLNDLPETEVVFLVAPSRQAFDRHLWDKRGWDILFFAGHSQTEWQTAGRTEDKIKNQTGRLYINEQSQHNSLTIEQLEEALKSAISKGLQLAIFNSCDGIGLASALGQLQIPQVVVMREPVPNQVAQQFLQHFLSAFAGERQPLYTAMRQARSQLQGLESQFPGASWLPVLCQNPAVAPIRWPQARQAAAKPLACPYRGLKAFRKADAHLFFGRDRAIQDLLIAVQQQPFVAVTGPSGSGKSSIIFAGLLPRLEPHPSSNPAQNWTVCTLRPGLQPFDALAKAIAPLMENTLEEAEPPSVSHTPAKDKTARQLSELERGVQFQSDPQTFHAAVRHIVIQQQTHFKSKKQQNTQQSRLLLIVDQFEELYTLCAPDVRQAFIDLLLAAVQSAPALTVLITLRADFYGHALGDRRLSDALQTGSYNIGPMNKAELRAAIEQPAAQLNTTLEPGLADQLISATWQQPGHLPLLSFALAELWSTLHNSQINSQINGQLTHQAYQAIGGVEAALANHADAAYAQLSVADQQRTARVFTQLVIPGEGTAATRRVATRAEIGENNWDVVVRLASARLVTTSQNDSTGEETAEIVHEALISAWGKLHYWIQTDVDFRRWQESLRRMLNLWHKSEREEAALLRGKQLAIAEEWLSKRLEDLSVEEQTFIRKSIDSQTQQVSRTRRRRRLTIAGLSAGLLLALGMSAALWRTEQKASLASIQAQTQAAEALFLSGQQLDSLIAALGAQKAVSRLITPNPITVQAVEQSLRQALANNTEVNRLVGHNSGAIAVVYDPNGQFIASAGKDGTVRLWAPDGRLINTLTDNTASQPGATWSLAISPDGQTILSASEDRTIRRWRRDGTLIDRLSGHEAEVNAVAFSPQGDRFASADESGVVKVWHATGEVLTSFQAHDQKIDAIAFHPTQPLLATGSGDHTIKLWTLAEKTPTEKTLIETLQQTLLAHTGTVRAVAFSPNGQTLASASADQTIRLWAINNSASNRTSNSVQNNENNNAQARAEARLDPRPKATLEATLEGHRNIVFALSFSPDGTTLASASHDHTLKLWQLKTRLALTTFSGHSSSVTGVAFSPDGQTIASASQDKTVRLWQPHNPIRTLLGKHGDSVQAVVASKNQLLLASSSLDGTIQLWQIGSKNSTTLPGDSQVYSLALSPDEQSLLSGDRSGQITLWPLGALADQAPAAKTIFPSRHSGWVTDVAFSPNGQQLVSSSKDGTIKLWQADGSLSKTLAGHTGGVNAIAYSPTGEAIASGGDDNRIKLWTPAGKLTSTLAPLHTAAINRIAYSPDGRLIASASDDSSVGLWRADGQFLARLDGHQEAVIDVAFSPDGKTLASSGADKTVRLWTEKGEELKVLSGYTQGATGLSFTYDGQQLAVGNVDWSLSLWSLEPALDINALKELSCQRIEDYLESSKALEKSSRDVCHR